MAGKSSRKKYLEIEGTESKYLHEGQLIEVSRAPEPTDINWQNLKIPTSVKWWNRLTSLLMTGVMLFLIATAILSISDTQEAKSVELAEAGQSQDHSE